MDDAVCDTVRSRIQHYPSGTEHIVGTHVLSNDLITPAQRGQALAAQYLEAAFGERLLANVEDAEKLVDKAAPSATAVQLYQFNLALALDHARRGNGQVSTVMLRCRDEKEMAFYRAVLRRYCALLGLDEHSYTSLVDFLHNESWGETDETRRLFWAEVAFATALRFDSAPESLYGFVCSLTARHRLYTAA